MALRRPMTLTEFLEWEERQELRWEFDGFAPVAMTGGTLGHGVIQANLMAALHRGLRGTPCRAVGSDVKIVVAGSVRCPDALVFCTPFTRTATVAADPVAVFEVLSPSTSSTDFIVKNEEYRDTPSIQRYVMLAQDRPAATVFARVEDDWVGHVMSGDAMLAMPEIGIHIPLAELYEGLAFEEAITAA